MKVLVPIKGVLNYLVKADYQGARRRWQLLQSSLSPCHRWGRIKTIDMDPEAPIFSVADYRLETVFFVAVSQWVKRAKTLKKDSPGHETGPHCTASSRKTRSHYEQQRHCAGFQDPE